MALGLILQQNYFPMNQEKLISHVLNMYKTYLATMSCVFAYVSIWNWYKKFTYIFDFTKPYHWLRYILAQILLAISFIILNSCCQPKLHACTQSIEHRSIAAVVGNSFRSCSYMSMKATVCVVQLCSIQFAAYARWCVILFITCFCCTFTSSYYSYKEGAFWNH